MEVSHKHIVELGHRPAIGVPYSQPLHNKAFQFLVLANKQLLVLTWLGMGVEEAM